MFSSSFELYAPISGAMMQCVLTGIDILQIQEWGPLRGLKIGLVAHPASVDRRLRTTVELLGAAPGVQLAALFGPEHGFLGLEQDLIAVRHEQTTWRGIPYHSLYGNTIDSLRPPPEQLRGLDALVIDLQDVGSRYYTYQATMLYCLEAASAFGLLAVVLDRPNPLGGDVVEGPTLQPAYESFVGAHPIAIRHGMTIGELAKLYHAERNLRGELRVVTCEGWRRAMSFDETGLPWVLPSPNMPTLDTAFVYPGQCLLEGTNLSEGRGTTRPFEICGAPWIDADKLAAQLGNANLPGVAFRPLSYRPTFQKFAGQPCRGVQIHVTDRQCFQSVRTGLAILHAMREQSLDRFDWRREVYEFVSDRLAIDLLFGSSRERLALEAGASPALITQVWTAEEAEFRRRRQEHLLYY
jgi:uncharacterized protein YbbC (DUF1343 family)